MGKRPFTALGTLVFAVVALLHLLRLFTHYQVILGTHTIPMWVSWLGMIIPGVLAVGMWNESRR